MNKDDVTLPVTQACLNCGAPKLGLLHSSDGEVSWVQCSQCGRRGPLAYSDHDAVKRWDAGEVYQRPVSRIEALTAENARLREALEPFVEGYHHTSIFLRSREKMHPCGQDLYAEDVRRARAALDNRNDR